jgi:hypothetical protein
MHQTVEKGYLPVMLMRGRTDDEAHIALVQRLRRP